MASENHTLFHKKVSGAGLLIATGIVFGDIGTSPLYTFSAVFHEGETISATKALGVLSCVLWTLFLLTTVKYILLVLRADNRGEGGIFSLYALVKRYFKPWLTIPAIIGAAFLIADGIITPPISVASAIEGLQKFDPELNTVPWVILILVLLFSFQQMGTGKLGIVFGPVMFAWFAFIGIMGILSINGEWEIFRALNPSYALSLLRDYPGGFWLLGGIFLCSTGAEALYSDMGHVGRNNIRWSWLFIKICLVLSYAGQTSWLIAHQGETLGNISPFYSTIPSSIYVFAVILATLATIIASQALISGCFTLVNEGIRLDIWPRHKVIFPGTIKGQSYIPVVNWFLMIACIGMVLYFEKSANMEAAFGLSVTLTMFVTSFLFVSYLYVKRVNVLLIAAFGILFLSIETMFLVANLDKISHGGWITLVIGFVLSAMMYIWHRGRKAQKLLTTYIPLRADQVKMLRQLSKDEEIPKYATHLIYLSKSDNDGFVEKKSMDSIFKPPVKRADVYWFLHINVTDEPFTLSYRLKTLAKDDVYHLTIDLGFRIEPRIDFLFRSILEQLVSGGELKLDESPDFKYALNKTGDYKFLLGDSYLSSENELPKLQYVLLRLYYNLKKIAVKEEDNFGLETNNILVEKYPLIVTQAPTIRLKRTYD
ncbi:MAG: KUP/HAK/KT family potassium transporter [Chitinophagaceae bacterium]|nr:KUP/HAK/KT family potassium transporter [Chitinophagaceae bacterium]